MAASKLASVNPSTLEKSNWEIFYNAYLIES
jgi:hypothetical protein